MSGWRRLVVSGVIAGAGLAGIGGVVGAGGRPMSTDLNPAEEVPGPGDPNASGHANITLNQGANEICFDLSWSEIDGTVAAAHIHVGPAGVAGPVVVACSRAPLPGPMRPAGVSTRMRTSSRQFAKTRPRTT